MGFSALTLLAQHQAMAFSLLEKNHLPISLQVFLKTFRTPPANPCEPAKAGKHGIL